MALLLSLFPKANCLHILLGYLSHIFTIVSYGRFMGQLSTVLQTLIFVMLANASYLSYYLSCDTKINISHRTIENIFGLQITAPLYL